MLKSEQRLNAVLADRSHGSRTITQGIVEVLTTDLAPSSVSLTGYLQFARRVLTHIPSFALVFDLLHDIGCRAFSDTRTVSAPELRQHVGAWAARWDAAQVTMREQGHPILADASAIVTFSASGAVAAMLAAARNGGRTLTVLGSEALPGGEGVAFLETIESQGHRVRQVSDSDLLEQVTNADLVLLGADAVFVNRFWNKVGTERLCRSANRMNVPVYVAAETSKWVPADWGLRIEPVADLPGASGTEHNAGPVTLFEPIPLDLVTAVVAESGLATVDAIGPIIAEKPTFGPLQQIHIKP